MRFARVRTPAGPRWARVAADGQGLFPPLPEELFSVQAGTGLPHPALEEPSDLDRTPPLAPVVPSKILAIGRNYAAHAAELGNVVPERPLLFLKAPTSVVGPEEPVLLPPDSDRVEHEVELGVVIGRRCRHLRREDALEAVFGYTVLCDVTARDLQRRDGQFARGKGFDTFCPVGPWIRTGLDPRDLAIACRVSGVERQSGRTRDMIFDVATLLATVSRVMTLMPGDLLATGTPEGVGPLRDGDLLECEVEGIGLLRNPVRRDEAVPDDATARAGGSSSS